METLFLRWAKQEGLWDGDEEAEKKIRGRGSPARLQEEQISPPVGPVEVGSADVQLRRLGNLVRRVQHLERLQRSAVRGQVEARRLWAKIRVASRDVLTEEQQIPLLTQRQPPTETDALVDLRDRLKGIFSAQSARGHIERIRVWEGRLRQAWKAKPWTSTGWSENRPRPQSISSNGTRYPH